MCAARMKPAGVAARAGRSQPRPLVCPPPAASHRALPAASQPRGRHRPRVVRVSAAAPPAVEAAPRPATVSAPPPRRPPLTQRARSDCKLVYLYDGSCRVCLALVDMLRSRRGSDSIYFENLVAPGFEPGANNGITKEEALKTIHVIDAGRGGTIVTGLAGIEALYGAVGLGWLMRLARLPLFAQAAEIAYQLVSKNRTSLGGGLGALSDGLLGLSRVAMEQRGEGSCAEDGECREAYAPGSEAAEAGDDEPGGAPAPRPPPAAASLNGHASNGHAANGNGANGHGGGGAAAVASSPAAGADVLDPPRRVVGSALDRTHILGVYYSFARKALTAAPVDVRSGALLAPIEVVPIGSTDVEAVTAGIESCIGAFGWKGILGVGLPGLLRSSAEPGGGGGEASEAYVADGTAREKRHSRMLAEAQLQERVTREVLVMTGAEAAGYAELRYGAAKGERGLVMVVTMGTGVGVALFDDGALVRNVLTSELTWSWKLSMWGSAPVPPPASPPDAPCWAPFAERASSYLSRLDAAFSPDVIILGGAAGVTARSWAPLVTGVRARLLPAQLGPESGVIGAACGGAVQIALRDDLLRVRSAIGMAVGRSPARLSKRALRLVFNKLDADASGLVTPAELAAAVNALGVSVPAAQLRETFLDIDAEGTGRISFDAFANWWADFVAASPVSYLHTEDEFDRVLAEESRSNRLVVLEVGFSYCRPCKAFEPIFKDVATRYPQHRFLRFNGNENVQLVHLGRDRLQIKSTPSFFFFKNGQQVGRTSGAKEDKFMSALAEAATASGTSPALPSLP